VTQEKLTLRTLLLLVAEEAKTTAIGRAFKEIVFLE
jgi:hypothetical protein